MTSNLATKNNSTSKCIIITTSVLLILSGLLLNQSVLNRFMYLPNGQISVLRSICVWAYDTVAVLFGSYWLVRRHKLSINIKTLVFFALTAILMLFCMEVTLQLLTRVSPSIDRLLSNKKIRPEIPDDVLGFRPNPAFPDHDKNGFRNNLIPPTADIVAIGDSQTYGTGVKRHQAWPQQLQSLSGQTVYNMSFGGYGPVEAMVLMKEAMHMKPKLIIFAIYIGNDLVDSYDMAYNYNLHTELKSDDPNIIQAITTRNNQSEIRDEIKAVTPWKRNRQIQMQRVPKKRGPSTIKTLKLLRLFFALEIALQETVTDQREYRWTCINNSVQENADMFETFESDDFKTVFTPYYHFCGVNIQDPRINEGLAISLKAIKKMKETAQKQSFDYLVILIPTKESTFKKLYTEQGLQPSKSIQQIIDYETEIRHQIEAFFLQHQISYINLLPSLKECFETVKQPYFVDADGHLSPAGHEMTAKVILEYLKQELDYQ